MGKIFDLNKHALKVQAFEDPFFQGVFLAIVDAPDYERHVAVESIVELSNDYPDHRDTFIGLIEFIAKDKTCPLSSKTAGSTLKALRVFAKRPSKSNNMIRFPKTSVSL